ncbi:MAG: hypothetical protein U0835_25020 [Isosphaeraceae bacterium]
MNPGPDRPGPSASSTRLLEWLARAQPPLERRDDVDPSGPVRDTITGSESESDTQPFPNEAGRRARPAEVPGCETVARRGAVRDELLARLVLSLETLPPDEKDAVELYFLDGALLAEVARRQSTTAAHAVGRIRRGLARLTQAPTCRPSTHEAQTIDRAGGTTPRLDEALAEYLGAVDEGRAQVRESLRSDHPDLNAELAAFFRDYDTVFAWVQVLLSPGAGRDETLTQPPRTRSTRPTEHGTMTPETLRVGRYELFHKEIGGGGQGIVYRGRQLGAVEQDVAVKMPRPEGFFEDGNGRVKLTHPERVRLTHLGLQKGRPGRER